MKTHYFTFSVIILSLYISSFVQAAPPPSEVEEIKNEAVLVLIGEVTEDLFIKGTTKSKNTPTQLRKMIVSNLEILKKPGNLQLQANDSVEVYYHYIPLWNINQYAGPARVNIAVGDIIKIWIDKGEYGWEPALSGNTIEHIELADIRPEPIQEPYSHYISRKAEALYDQHLGKVVLGFVIALIISIIIYGLKNPLK